MMAKRGWGLAEPPPPRREGHPAPHRQHPIPAPLHADSPLAKAGVVFGEARAAAGSALRGTHAHPLRHGHRRGEGARDAPRGGLLPLDTYLG